MTYRTATDSMGSIKVPADAYYDAQTARSYMNFAIGSERMPREVIYAYAIVKKAAALANNEYGDLTNQKTKAICKACDEVLQQKFDDQFPLKVWQTGSGTQTNMNVNEVIANRAIEILGGRIGSKTPVHPNDDVNMSQSSNDTFPTAMHIAAALKLRFELLPTIRKFRNRLDTHAKKYKKILKIGRTHMMDATPISFGDELSAYVVLLDKNLIRIKESLKGLYPLAIGGTAVGTGLNSKKGFGTKAAKHIAKLTSLPFKANKNSYEAISMHDALVQVSSCLEQLASTLIKIANDIRLLNSGPRCGYSEISIPANEPGSSIMPGKVNPTQAEALLMVCLQVKGNHTTVSAANNLAEFQLNVGKPVIIYNVLQQIQLLADGIHSFHEKCITDMQPHEVNMKKHLENSLMLVTALNKHIGYDNAAKIAKKAHQEGITLKESAISLGLLTEKEFESYVQAKKMIQPTP